MDDLNEAIQHPPTSAILEAQGALTFASAVGEKGHISRLLVRHILLDSVQYLIEELKEGLYAWCSAVHPTTSRQI